MAIVLTEGMGFSGRTPLRRWAAQTGQRIASDKVTVLHRNPGEFLKPP
jgi:hypothetical protein